MSASPTPQLGFSLDTSLAGLTTWPGGVCVPEEQRTCQLGLCFKTSVLALDQELLQGDQGQSQGEEGVSGEAHQSEAASPGNQRARQPPDLLSSLVEARDCRGGLGFPAFISYSCLESLFKI